ncbi:TetR/AcrR family transcriptional regulator [Pseudomaricurvus sp. HS19]|uniref:TetR/AcrR family transcriptional regulator n=1 Tax=Pseudomaricurvus sp. HS19 TaxID=2692626 RepID=UPI00136A19E5|nr:TetR family transcriptional regulator [Pseudomaricurvus sp. HS19]MYM64003.1 TetR family transcriptional regulator [Pseudomaricurvus sp. HS19]
MSKANAPAPGKSRTRNDPRKEATRIAIMEAAETLFAQSGIEGVSLRQIGAAIGSSNTSVVAYHFGSKEALVEAIFHYRLPAIDARRRELLQEALGAGNGNDPLTLLRAIWLPLFEQVNETGQHSYAGFMSMLMYSTVGDIRLAVSSDYPTTNELGERLQAAMPDALKPLFDTRMLMNTVMVTGALKMIDQAPAAVDGAPLFADTLRMAAAALLAPR